ncbi:acetate--CoA ligase [Oceanobacillus piezotolerans]|uniref:Acetate--CoA ligase n=1 Tax=Oceanobacillus piezotolerans TaxID=2448030 RepID=A0A498D8U2_9BACI|nr:AMP-binding protein [Oceanobacillus piezotolerans]RLL46823.1 acetate--CoA ligase [Oceanobacillus piezotolerans]
MKYEELIKQFSWNEAEKEFSGNPNGVFNIAYEICDRWAKDPNRVAIQWEDISGEREEWTYKKLKEESDRMANAMKSMGIKKGDRIAGLLGKEMELVIMFIATWKIGAVYVPLFTAFGPDAILHRIKDCGVKLLLTNEEQKRKLEGIDISFEVLLADGLTDDGKTFWEYVHSFSCNHEIEKTLGDEPAIIQYTSGTTGLPKGAIMKQKSLFSIYPYFKYAMHIEEEDIFFGGPDLGWAFGLIACTLGPLKFGARVVLYNGRFDVEKLYQVFERYHVTSLAYTPTAYRMMMAARTVILKKYRIKISKFSSAGEPLDGEVVKFFEKNFGRAIYDHYGSTETSNIVNNYNIVDMKIKPGSMGLPLPGYQVVLIDEKGNLVKRGETGQIAVETNREKACFGGYWNNDEKLKEKILGKWLLTGDLAKQDEEGYFWFQGRADDIISSAGYRIGPTEVEASLMEHPVVLEAAVVGKPDGIKGEIVKAFIVLNDMHEPSEDLKQELSLFVKNKLSKHQYPREIEFLKELPKTQSGKIQRTLLKRREYEK